MPEEIVDAQDSPEVDAEVEHVERQAVVENKANIDLFRSKGDKDALLSSGLITTEDCLPETHADSGHGREGAMSDSTRRVFNEVLEYSGCELEPSQEATKDDVIDGKHYTFHELTHVGPDFDLVEVQRRILDPSTGEAMGDTYDEFVRASFHQVPVETVR